MIDHPEWQALLRAVIAEPDNLVPRLVAADWLEEHDEEFRAEFIRVQCELRRLASVGEGNSSDAYWLRHAAFRYDLNEFHNQRLLWAVEGCPGILTPANDTDARAYRAYFFHRGFVEELHCTLRDWQEHGSAVLQRSPIQKLRLGEAQLLTSQELLGELLPLLRPVKQIVIVDATPTQADWFFHHFKSDQLEVRLARMEL